MPTASTVTTPNATNSTRVTRRRQVNTADNATAAGSAHRINDQGNRESRTVAGNRSGSPHCHDDTNDSTLAGPPCCCAQSYALGSGSTTEWMPGVPVRRWITSGSTQNAAPASSAPARRAATHHRPSSASTANATAVTTVTTASSGGLRANSAAHAATATASSAGTCRPAAARTTMPVTPAVHAMAMSGNRSGTVVSTKGLSNATTPAANTATGRRTNADASHATAAAVTARTTVNHSRCANSGEPPRPRTTLSRPRSSSIDEGTPVEPVPVVSVFHNRVTPVSPRSAGPTSPAAMNVPARNHVCGSSAPTTAAAGTPQWARSVSSDARDEITGGAAISISPGPAVMRRMSQGYGPPHGSSASVSMVEDSTT